MKVQLTARWKFVCDRCGKEVYSNDEGYVDGSEMANIVFLDRQGFFEMPIKKREGEICKECFNDFVELANNFFDEVNKKESEGND